MRNVYLSPGHLRLPPPHTHSYLLRITGARLQGKSQHTVANATTNPLNRPSVRASKALHISMGSFLDRYNRKCSMCISSIQWWPTSLTTRSSEVEAQTRELARLRKGGNSGVWRPWGLGKNSTGPGQSVLSCYGVSRVIWANSRERINKKSETLRENEMWKPASAPLTT